MQDLNFGALCTTHLVLNLGDLRSSSRLDRAIEQRAVLLLSLQLGALSHARARVSALCMNRRAHALLFALGLAFVALAFGEHSVPTTRYSRWKKVKKHREGDGGWDVVFVREPVDCMFSRWSRWSGCSQSHEKIKAAFQFRSRSVITSPMFGGRQCPHLKQARACKSPARPAPPPKPCALRQWSDWSGCTNGTQYRNRDIEREPEPGAAACAHLKEVRECRKPLLQRMRWALRYGGVQLQFLLSKVHSYVPAFAWSADASDTILRLRQWVRTEAGDDVIVLLSVPALLVLFILSYRMLGSASNVVPPEKQKLEQLVARRRTSSNSILPRTPSKEAVGGGLATVGEFSAAALDTFDPWADAAGESTPPTPGTPKTPTNARTPPPPGNTAAHKFAPRQLRFIPRPRLELSNSDDTDDSKCTEQPEAKCRVSSRDNELRYSIPTLMRLMPDFTPRPQGAHQIDGAEPLFGENTAIPLIAEANPVGRLKEYAQRKGKQRSVEYIEVKSPVGWGFAYKVLVDGHDAGIGYARNKKQAKHSAAAMAIGTIKAHPDLKSFVLPQLQTLMSPVSRGKADAQRWKKAKLPDVPDDDRTTPVEPLQIDEETRWKASVFVKCDEANKTVATKQSDNSEKALRKVTALLNKITLEKFKQLSAKLIEEVSGAITAIEKSKIDDFVIEVSRAVVRKAQGDPHFSMMYASLCKSICAQPVEWAKSFRRHLMSCAKADFEGQPHLVAKLRSAWDTMDADERAEKEIGCRKCWLSHMKLLASLHICGMYSEDQLHEFCDTLQIVTQSQVPEECHPCDPCAIEKLCVLLQNVGKFTHTRGSAQSNTRVRGHVVALQKLAQAPALAARMKFMIRDLADLSAQNWQPRRMEEQPTTIAEVHAAAAKEEAEKVAQTPRRGRFNSFDQRDRTPRATPRPTQRATPRATHTTPRAKRPSATAAAWAAAAGMPTPRRGQVPPPLTPAPQISSRDLGAKCAARLRERGPDGQVQTVCDSARENLVGQNEEFCSTFVASMIEETLQRSQSDRSRAAQCISLLSDEGLISQQHVSSGVSAILDVVDDIAIDVPHVRDYMGKVIQQLSLNGALTITQLPRQHATIWNVVA